MTWTETALTILEEVIQTLTVNSQEADNSEPPRVGRPTPFVSIPALEFLLAQRFLVVTVAKLFRVSRQDLESRVGSILREFPMTGYKRMKGFLLPHGIRVTDYRVRESMRNVDPEGVYYRTLSNRDIV